MKIKINDKIANLRDAIFKVKEVTKNGTVNTVCVDKGRSRVHHEGKELTIELSDIDTPRCNYTLHFIS